MRKKIHFGIKGFALTLALKQRLEASLEWPISEQHFWERAWYNGTYYSHHAIQNS